MDAITAAGRIGGFVMFVAEDGRRHAVRLGAVLALSDGDEDRSTTVMQLPGSRVVLIHVPLDEVLTWFG